VLVSLDNLGRVFTPAPVNRHHPLNRGRAGWWLGLPGLTGGRQFPDLMGLNHGVLTSMGNTSNGWRSTTRPGGRSQIITDGSAGYVDCGTPAGLNGATQATLACWIYRAATSTAVAFGASAGSNRDRFSCIWFSDGNLYAAAEDSGNFFFFCPANTTGWHRVVVVFDSFLVGNSNRYKIYFDGIQQSLSFNGSAANNLGTVGPLTIGKDSIARFGAGAYDDFSLWLRPLTATEVQQDYILSRKGYPDVLNRLSTRVYSMASASPPSSTLFRRSLTNRTGSRSAA
jgi:hypothetical protein